MTLTVSINQFRKHIADYIAKANAGHTIILRDEKKGQQIARLIGERRFDPEAFEKALRQAAGVFTAKNHPEWRTKKDVIRWVEKSRRAFDRRFD